MLSISDIQKKYSKKLDFLDLEIILAHSLGKTREFVLSHPEFEIPSLKIENLKLKISRRMRGEPIAQILGHKEFYGLDFVVNKHTLVPRPETEQMVELTLDKLKVESKKSKVVIIDVGTGSGCIITSIAKKIETFDFQPSTFNFIGTDISKDALKIARKNARIHGLQKNIKFIHSSLLSPFFENCKLNPPAGGENSTMIIVANLPYLSKEIYTSAPIDVKNFEPKSALYSPEHGLQHYRKLLLQIKKLKSCNILRVKCYMEISPEQKKLLTELVKKILPQAKMKFHKDLAAKWRICEITIA